MEQRIIRRKGAAEPASPAPAADRADDAAPLVRNVRIDGGSDGQRLDNFLAKVLKGVPRTHLYRVIRSGEVRVNKGRAAADTRLALGDEVRIPPMRVADRSERPEAPGREFAVVHEDDAIVCIDKPAGIAVHGGSGESFGVIEQMRRARPDAFLELVHRLDKDTTADGSRHVRVVDADDERGRRSISLVRVARSFAGFSLLDVTLKTGRTHQIRVHLADAGHPIAGDPKYGNFALNRALARGQRAAPLRFDRMFLHARRLRFVHPATGAALELEAPLPAACEALLAALEPAG